MNIFEEYACVPRAPELGFTIHGQLRTAWRGVIGVAVGAFVLGIPFSFVRFRKSRPWEPSDMIIGGAILAAFSVPIALAVVQVFRKYVRIFRTGRLVEGLVVEGRGTGSLLRVSNVVGPDLTFIPGMRIAPGTKLPVIVGPANSSLVLVVESRGVLRRGSLLTHAQLSQLVVQ